MQIYLTSKKELPSSVTERKTRNWLQGDAAKMVKKAIKESGMTQNRFCLLSGISIGSLASMLSGRNKITPEMAVRMEELLDLTAEGILITQMNEQLRDARDARRGVERPQEVPESRHRCNRMDKVFRRCLSAHNHQGECVFA